MRQPGGLLVLVVGNHHPSAEALAHLFQREGHEVRVAADGAAAIQAARTEQPDVVFLDILPPGGDAFEAARGIRGQSAWRRPLFVALAGCGDAQSLRRSHEAGIDLHLVKPVRPGALCGLLRRFQTVVGDVSDFDPRI